MVDILNYTPNLKSQKLPKESLELNNISWSYYKLDSSVDYSFWMFVPSKFGKNALLKTAVNFWHLNGSSLVLFIHFIKIQWNERPVPVDFLKINRFLR